MQNLTTVNTEFNIFRMQNGENRLCIVNLRIYKKNRVFKAWIFKSFMINLAFAIDDFLGQFIDQVCIRRFLKRCSNDRLAIFSFFVCFYLKEHV